MVFIDFPGSKPPKIHKKSMRKRIRKKHRKKSSQNSILASQNLQKSLQNHEKSLRNAMQNEACFATLCNLLASRRKLTVPMVCKASKWLGIWLGLLHPSIHPSIDLPLVALIIKVRSATWHAPRIFLLTRRGNQKTSSGGSFYRIHENRALSASKSIQKAA